MALPPTESSGIHPDWSGRLELGFTLALLGLACIACSAATDGDFGDGPELAEPSAEDLKGCHGKASSSIPESGVYVLTTFGGPSESQALACGGHSSSGSWYYAASRQRYGCGSRIAISANGKCAVAQTDDYGPDVCVEKAAGFPVMDVSPLVAKHLFGKSSFGWSDGKKVTVAEVGGDTPLGPCSTDAPTEPGGSGGTSGSAGSGGSGGGQPCSSDGECNPGDDGSGLICVGGTCVPGCKTNAQCPGNTTCISGQCG